MSGKPERKRIETPVLIALIGLCGTLLAALVSSPLLLKFIEDASATQTPAQMPTLMQTFIVTQGSEVTETATATNAPQTTNTPNITQTPVIPTIAPPANATLIFNQDFENGSTSGFGFQSGDWNLTRDKSNRVLEGDATSFFSNQTAVALFGSTDFSNGVIELKINFVKIGGFYILFRSNSGARYSFYLTGQEAMLGYETEAQNWAFDPLGAETVRSFSTQASVWYTVHLEIRGEQIIAYLDGNRLFSANDARLQKGALELNLDSGTKVLLDDVKVWSFDQ